MRWASRRRRVGADVVTAAAQRRAILCVLGASALFALAAALVKAVAPFVPLAELVFFRSAVASVVLLPLLRGEGGWSALRTRRPWSHLGRILAGLAGMFGAFYGYATLPLAAVTALGFAMPLVLAVLAGPLLGERIGWGRAVAVLAGFAGVLVMVEPWRGAGSCGGGSRRSSSRRTPAQ